MELLNVNQKYVQQVRKRQSNYRPLIERVQEIVRVMNLPIDIFVV